MLPWSSHVRVQARPQLYRCKCSRTGHTVSTCHVAKAREEEEGVLPTRKARPLASIFRGFSPQ